MDENSQAAQKARDAAMQMSQSAITAAGMCKGGLETANGLATALEKLGQAMGENAGWRAVAIELGKRLAARGEPVDLNAIFAAVGTPVASAVGKAFADLAAGARAVAAGLDQTGQILDKHAQGWKQEANVWHSAIDNGG